MDLMHRSSMKIALVTDRERPDLTPDDRLLLPALRKRGVDVSAEPWDSKTADWGGFDLCILRSCWDYHLRVSEFLRWLEHLEKQNVGTMNPIPTVRWNYDKRYLKDLEKQGIPIVPTFIPNGEDSVTLKGIMSAQGWDDVVLKPRVSAGAYRTHRVGWNDVDAFEQEFHTITRESGVLVQTFVPEIQSAGEWSFLFFDREFSHAVLKMPVEGEYRSQELYGGSSLSAIPSPMQVQQAARVIEAVPDDLLFARVDMIEVDGRMLLGELEVIEPSLFFMCDPDSPHRFVEKLIRYLQDKT